MKKTNLLLPLLALAALSALASGAHAQTTGAAPFFNNTIYCQNQTDLASCSLWLNQDGTYEESYNRGVQKIVPQSAAGPFQFEGREGTYTTRIIGGKTEACLKPDTSTNFVYNTEKAGEIYAGDACYELPVLAIGSSEIMKTPDGKTYKIWLLSGR